MCGRYALTVPPEVLARILQLVKMAVYSPRANIAPTQNAPVVRLVEGAGAGGRPGRTLELLRWGLIPEWAKDKDIGLKAINARSEGIETKPMFRRAIRRQRCLVPASGFIEWEKRPDGKQPHYFHAGGEQVVCFAGLWESWVDVATGEEIKSYTIVTTNANEKVRPVHDRMPVIVEPGDFDRWLDPEVEFEDVKNLLRAAREDVLSEHLVSRRINGSREDDPSLLKPVRADQADVPVTGGSGLEGRVRAGVEDSGRGKRRKSAADGGMESLFGKPDQPEPDR